MFLGGSYISESVHTQWMLFLAAIMWGAAVALAYDGLRVLRRIWPPPVWLYYTQDLLFWLAEALLIYRLLFIYDNGAVRSYTMLGMILGMALYLWIFGRWLSGLTAGILNKIMGLIKKCLKRISHFLGIPLRPIRWLLWKIWTIAVKKYKHLKNSVNSPSKMLKKKGKKGRIEVIENNSE